jgi:lipoprotein-releasing system permease protein
VSYEWFVAKRYFRARRRSRFLSFISSFTIAGIMLGTAAMILTLTILGGFEREIKDKVIGFTSHIEVEAYQNRLLPSYQKTVANILARVKGVKSVAPYVAKEGMIRSHSGVDGIFVKGIDPSTDVSMSRSLIVSGRYLQNQTQTIPEIVLGKKLADELVLKPGEKVVVLAIPAGSEGGVQPKAMQFVLVGVYESGMSEYDDVYGYTTMQSAQQLFDAGDNATGFDILVDDISHVDAIAGDIQELLGYPYHAQTVFETYRNLFSWVDLQRKLSPILLSLITLVATVNIIGTVLMYVLEKTEAIAVLKSMGAAPAGLRRIFMLQGVAMAFVGIAAGNLLAFFLAYIQLKWRVISLPADVYYMTAVPIHLDSLNFALVSAVVLVLCFLTSILPARAASRMNPVDVFRFG